jgi:ribosome-associated protein YbcJ (S4-like RNA binding protein)
VSDPITRRVFKIRDGDLIENKEIFDWIDEQGKQMTSS